MGTPLRRTSVRRQLRQSAGKSIRGGSAGWQLAVGASLLLSRRSWQQPAASCQQPISSRSEIQRRADGDHRALVTREKAADEPAAGDVDFVVVIVAKVEEGVAVIPMETKVFA